MFVPPRRPCAATNVRPLTPIGAGGEFPRKLSFSRPLAQAQRGEGKQSPTLRRPQAPPRPMITRGSLEVTSAGAEAAELLTHPRQRRDITQRRTTLRREPFYPPDCRLVELRAPAACIKRRPGRARRPCCRLRRISHGSMSPHLENHEEHDQYESEDHAGTATGIKLRGEAPDPR